MWRSCVTYVLGRLAFQVHPKEMRRRNVVGTGKCRFTATRMDF